MSDRVAVILGGALRQIATPSVLYRDPDDLAVARFVGTPRINVLPATATAKGADVLGAAIAVFTGLPAGTRLQLAIRPERMTARSGAGTFAGRLVYRENLGSDLFLHVALGGAPGTLIVRCDPSLLDAVSLGDRIHIDLSAEHLLLFDTEGKRIRPVVPGEDRG